MSAGPVTVIGIDAKKAQPIRMPASRKTEEIRSTWRGVTSGAMAFSWSGDAAVSIAPSRKIFSSDPME